MIEEGDVIKVEFLTGTFYWIKVTEIRWDENKNVAIYGNRTEKPKDNL